MVGNDNWLDDVAEQLEASADLKKKLTIEDKKIIVNIAQLIVDSYKNGGKVILFGNGGSAADAQHIAGELNRGISGQFKGIQKTAFWSFFEKNFKKTKRNPHHCVYYTDDNRWN